MVSNQGNTRRAEEEKEKEPDGMIGGRKRVEQPVEERSPHNQAMGSKDPDDYPISGPLPIGNAPVHQTKKGQEGIPTGVVEEKG
jgi:hypothetical protein